MESSPTSIVGSSNARDAKIKKLEETISRRRCEPDLSQTKSNSTDEPEMSAVQQFYRFSSDEYEKDASALLEKNALLQTKLKNQDAELQKSREENTVLQNLIENQNVDMKSDYLVVRKLKEKIGVLQGDLAAREDGNLALSRIVKALKDENFKLHQKQAKKGEGVQSEFVLQLQRNLEELRRGHDNQDELVAKFKHDSSILEQEIKEQSEVIEKMKASTATLIEYVQKKQNQNTEDAAEQKELIRNLTNENASMENKVINMEIDNEALREESDSQKRDIEALREKLGSQTRAIEAKQAEKESQKKDIEELQKENSELKTENEYRIRLQGTITDNVGALQIEVVNLKEAYEVLQNEKGAQQLAMNDTIKALQEELDSGNQRDNGAASLKNKVTVLENENKSTLQLNEALREKVEKSEDAISNLQEANVVLEEENAEMDKSIAAMKARMDKKEWEIRQRKEQVAALKEEFSATEKELYETINANFSKLEMEAADCKNGEEALPEGTDRLMRILEIKMANHEMLKEGQRVLQEAYETLSSEKYDLRNELSVMEEKLKTQKSQYIMLQKAMVDKEARHKFAAREELERLDEFHRQLRNDNTVLLSQNKYLNEKIDDLNSRMREKDYKENLRVEEQDALKRCHVELQKCVRDLTSQLSAKMNKVNYALKVVQGEVVVEEEYEIEE